jgi:hypothetical protein
MPYIVSFLVAVMTSGITLGALVAAGGERNGSTNIVIVTLATLAITFASHFVLTRRITSAAGTSVLFTVIVVGGGLLILRALFASVCGLDPSAC